MASIDDNLRRTIGLEILGSLWGNGISAELADNINSTDELRRRVKDDDHPWVVVVKPNKSLRVKTTKRTDVADADMPVSRLVPWLQNEIRERATAAPKAANERDSAAQRPIDQEVSILPWQQKNKKMIRQAVTDQAQASVAGFVQSAASGPILGVDATDAVLTLIQGTPLSNADGWKKVEQVAGAAEKGYVRQIHEELRGWREKFKSGRGSTHCFFYNFQTGRVIYYDVGL